MGLEGSMDELIMKARFEEAKTKEFAAARTSVPFPRRLSAPHGDPVTTSTPGPARNSWKSKPDIRTEERHGSDPVRSGRSGIRKCFNCGLEGHLAHACTYRKPTRGDQEAHGRRTVSMVTLEKKPEKRATEERIAEMKQELQKAELAAAIEAAGTLNTMEATGDAPGARLGPTVCTPIEVNGITTKALIDTGSPATIISLAFVLRVLAGERTSDQTLEEWKEATHQKFASPDLALNNYGGQRLSLIAQIELTLLQGDRHSLSQASGSQQGLYLGGADELLPVIATAGCFLKSLVHFPQLSPYIGHCDQLRLLLLPCPSLLPRPSSTEKTHHLTAPYPHAQGKPKSGL